MDNSVSTHSVEDLAKALKTARERGQQVVPIVGAGLSADCGFPVITAVVRYFGKLYRYIQLRGPVYDYRKHKELKHDIFDHHFSGYEVRPWEFLEDFGWPDWFQLNEDLFRKLDVDDREEPVSNLIESAERKELDEILQHFNPHGVEEYSKLYKSIEGTLKKLKKRTPSKKAERLRKAIDESREEINTRFLTNWSKSAKFDVIGDWRRLILYFTNYRGDYADALFARFGATRKPSQGHRFLAFLSKVLAVRTILTFNFDSLIEEAMETEGIRCKVFAMERGAGLPYQNLLRDQLSVIKAHGSTHALLLDEQLDRPLSKEYLKRFYRITGEDPVLLVVGCSAEDRRLRDLVSHVLESSKRELAVAWLHYESSPPSFLRKNSKLRRKTLALPTNNPGATLLHLYSWLMNGNPASRVPYMAHIQQPIELASGRSKQSNNGSSTETGKGQFDWIAVDESRFLTASQILLKRANEWARNGYQFIWIDLESLHTFAGVIGSIIDQCRKYDPDLAPSLLPVDVDQVGGDVPGDSEFLEKVIEPAAARVVRALRRARYYLAIDGLSTYAWPATTHHGLTHRTITPEAQRRVDRMVDFLETLEKKDLGESRIGVGLDKPGPRYEGLKLPNPDCFDELFEKARRQREEEEKRHRKKPKPNRLFDFDKHFSPLRDLPIFSLKKIPSELEQILSSGPTQENDDLRYSAVVAMVLFSLSCFRRTRPLVATNRLLEPLLGETIARERLQQILKVFTEPGDIGILQQLEGGSYWFNHSIRDQIYEKNTKYTSISSMQQCLTVPADDRANREHRRNAVFQLFLGAITHHRISQIWYNHTFVQSRDTFAFLEYTYHRISSIRNLVKLRALARVGTSNEVIAEDLFKGISKCSELIRLLDENYPPFKQLDFGDDGPFLNVLRTHSEADSSSRDWCDEARQIQESLQRRHCRQLHGLYRGWTRAELTLRTQLPAEQLLHWCDELLTDDLVQRCNRLVINYRETGEWSYEAEYYKFTDTKLGDLIDPELEQENGDLKEFRRFLQDLQVKLWIERSDYATCIRHRRKHLWHSLGETSPPAREDIELSQDVIDRCGIRQCHQLLNIANCKLKLQQELTCDEKGLKKETAQILELLEKIKTRLQDLIPKTRHARLLRSNEHNEAWLRLLHLQAEAQIGHVSMFSHNGFTGDPQHWKPEATDVDKALLTVTQGLEEIGARDVHTRSAPRSVILHPTADAALYLQYRSVFHMFKSRIEWLADESPGNLNKALRSFEMARGGLDNDSPLISALIDIYMTEAQLARGRFVLFDPNSETGFQQAQEAYDSAWGALRRARESLIVSHRHLMWRKLFFRIATQYHSDRLLLRYAKVQQRALTHEKRSEKADRKKYFEENARDALLRLRRAYQTLVSALDLYLPLSAKNGSVQTSKTETKAHSNRFRWLYRIWWELTLCGYATGRVVIDALRGNAISEDEAHKYVIQQLEWLNEADCVDDSALEEVFAKNFHCLRPEYDRLLKDTKGTTHLMTALSRRRKLIQQANELSEEWVGIREINRLDCGPHGSASKL